MVVNGRKAKGTDKAFNIVIIVIVALLAILFMLPLINVLSSSFSDPKAVVTGKVGLLPVDFSTIGYETIFKEGTVWRGFGNTILYTLIGTIITVSCQMLCAYPLSRRDFKGKKVLSIFLTLTMFISGGMIPTYLVISQMKGVYNTLWAIILPGCISVFNIIVIRTYMTSSINYELQEAAMIDGCGDWRIFTHVILPLSRPIIFVMVLYAIVGYWNSYFNAMMYVKDSTLYPLQNVLNNILIKNDGSIGGGDPNLAEQLKYVIIVVSSVPLLVIYPFFQKYFEKGVTIGGIKG